MLKLVVINDCGTVMYASGAESQQIGGQCQGMGEALTEEIIYDKATGIPLNFNWIDYTIPTMADMPEIEPVLLEVWKGSRRVRRLRHRRGHADMHAQGDPERNL